MFSVRAPGDGPSSAGALRFLFLSSSAFGSPAGLIPIICRISLEVKISFRVNLSAISAMSLTGTSLKGSLKMTIDWKLGSCSLSQKLASHLLNDG